MRKKNANRPKMLRAANFMPIRRQLSKQHVRHMTVAPLEATLVDRNSVPYC